MHKVIPCHKPMTTQMMHIQIPTYAFPNELCPCPSQYVSSTHAPVVSSHSRPQQILLVSYKMCVMARNVTLTLFAVGPEAHVEAYFPARVGSALADDAFQCATFDDRPTSFVSEVATKVCVCTADRMVGSHHVGVTFAKRGWICRGSRSSVHAPRHHSSWTGVGLSHRESAHEVMRVRHHHISFCRPVLVRRGSAHVKIAKHAACHGGWRLHVCVFVYGGREPAATEEEVVVGFIVDGGLMHAHLWTSSTVLFRRPRGALVR